jgi:hypothetical protein
MACRSDISYRLVAHMFWYVGRVTRSSMSDLLRLILLSFCFGDLFFLLNGDLACSCRVALVFTIE